MMRADEKGPHHEKRMKQAVRVYHNATQASKAMGVCSTTVRRWAKDLGLKFREKSDSGSEVQDKYYSPERWFP